MTIIKTARVVTPRVAAGVRPIAAMSRPKVGRHQRARDCHADEAEQLPWIRTRRP
jgi:hypothetical protein